MTEKEIALKGKELKKEKLDISASRKLEEEIMSNPKAIEHSTKLKILNEKIGMIQQQSKETSAAGGSKELKNQLRELNREKNRIIKFYAIVKNPEIYGDMAKDSDVDNISASNLLKIDAKLRGFLSSSFAFKQTAEANGEIKEEPLDADRLGLGDDIIIDFGKNNQANRKIGAGDVLPSKVRIVEVIDTKGNSRIGLRDISGSRVGYYDENARYVPVFNGYKLHIPKDEELKDPKYKEILSKTEIKSAIMSNAEELAKIEGIEDKAKLQYIGKLEQFAKAEKYNQMIEDLSQGINSASYKEKLGLLIQKAKGLMESGDARYPKEDLMMIISRLEKTLEIIGNSNLLGLDIDKYKNAICSHESGGDYFARNDEAGRKRGVSPSKWAFGKYQFTSETCNDYLKKMGAQTIDPNNEESIQTFLSNPSLQEQVMDMHIISTIQGTLMPKIQNNEISLSADRDMNYYLALTHIGGPGALNNQSRADWLGTSVSKYAMNVAEMSRNGFSGRIKTDMNIEYLTKITPDALVSAAEYHIGKGYVLGAGRGNNTDSTDCSGLVLMSMKQAGVCKESYNSNAEGLTRLTKEKSPSDVQKGDLVFLRETNGRISHIEIATGPITSRGIPIIDSSKSAGGVTERYQKISSKVIVGTPTFYS